MPRPAKKILSAALAAATVCAGDAFVLPAHPTASAPIRPSIEAMTTLKRSRGGEQEGGGDDHEAGGGSPPAALSRRDLFRGAPAALASLLLHPGEASANLMQFPCQDGTLRNTYNIMRAGESLLEADNILETNPMFL